jgi:hypothetical protein
MLYIRLRGHCCDIIVLNVYAQTEELEHVFDQLTKYHVKIMLGDFNAKSRDR